MEVNYKLIELAQKIQTTRIHYDKIIIMNFLIILAILFVIGFIYAPWWTAGMAAMILVNLHWAHKSNTEVNKMIIRYAKDYKATNAVASALDSVAADAPASDTPKEADSE